jgi:glycosyltransferase involved in cell wall biosynthesis
MRVLVSVVGRFHAFDLANQLQKTGVLYKLNTTYPKKIAKRWGIKIENIHSNILLEFLNRYFIRWFPFIKSSLSIFIYKKQARSNRQFLSDADILISWSGASLEAIIEAKKNNVITILERGSCHYSLQMNLLVEEYARMGKVFNPNYPVWQRELLEYELTDFISIPSIFAKKSFIEYGIPESKLLVNPYGVDLTSFKQTPKEDSVFRVVYAGALSFRKGAQYLLQVFYELDLPNSELWHLGFVAEELKPIVKKYQSDKIKYLGHKPQNELHKYYSQGSVFVLMSLEDGFGMVIPQAMACGLPLIATNNTGGSDLITQDGEEGFVINIRDTEALKEKLLYLYQNPEVCHKMGQKAKHKVREGFTWDDYGNRYVEILKKIVE